MTRAAVSARRPERASPRARGSVAGTAPAAAALSRRADMTLVEQLAGRFAERIGQRLLAPGSRLPSVRECARRHAVSPYTVVAAYDQLQAKGLVEAQGAARLLRARARHAHRHERARRRRSVARAAVAEQRHRTDPRHVPGARRPADAGTRDAARRMARRPHPRRGDATRRRSPAGVGARAALRRSGRRAPPARSAGEQDRRLRHRRRAGADRHHRRRDARPRHRHAHAPARRRQRAGRRARLVGRVRAPGRAGHARAAGAARRQRPRHRGDAAHDRSAAAGGAAAPLRHRLGAAQPDRRVAEPAVGAPRAAAGRASSTCASSRTTPTRTSRRRTRRAWPRSMRSSGRSTSRASPRS